MPVKVAWLNDLQQVIVYRFSGKWTWDECYLANDTGRAMVRSVPHAVYVLAITEDEVSSRHIPPNTVTHLPNLTKMMPENSRLAVIVSSNAAWLALDKIMSRLSSVYSERIRFAPDVETAYRYLREYASRHGYATPALPAD
jgi:hypothetical protein